MPAPKIVLSIDHLHNYGPGTRLGASSTIIDCFLCVSNLIFRFSSVLKMPSNDHCCVSRCSNGRRTSPTLYFHSFQLYIERRKRWLVAIRRDEVPNCGMTSSTVVCSEHFLPTDFHVSAGGQESADSLRTLPSQALDNRGRPAAP